MFEFAPCLQTHDDALAVGREPRREAHAGKVADDFALPGLDVVEVDARIALAVGHVGDLLRRRREPRGEHEFVAARQIAHVGAVLIHDGEPLDAPLARTGLVDEDDTAVEVAAVAGEPLVDRIRNDVGDAAPIVRRGEILLAGELLAGEHVPEPEFGFQSAVVLPRNGPGDERLRVDAAPIGKPRHGVDAGDRFDKRGRIDRGEQAAALQVGGDDLGDAGCGVVVALAAADEFGDGDRQRLKIALGDIEADHRCGVTRHERQTAGDGAERNRAPARQEEFGPVAKRHDVRIRLVSRRATHADRI